MRWINLFPLFFSACLVLSCSGKTKNDNTDGFDATVNDLKIEDGSTDGKVSDGNISDSVRKDAKKDSLLKRDLLSDSSASPSIWKVVASSNAKLYGIWGRNEKEIFAVGQGGQIMHYDGKLWSTKNSIETNDLFAVWGQGTKAWAVGEGIDLVYDGTSWSNLSSSSTYSLRGLWGAPGGKYLYAVGALTYMIRYLSLTNDSTYWSTGYLPDKTEDAMYGVWGLSDNEVYIVGDNGIILRCSQSCISSSYSSSKYTPMTSNTTANLRSIYGFSSNEIYAVGFDGVVLFYNGKNWIKQDLKTQNYFYGVWGSSANDVYVVGHPIFKTDESIFHFDGTQWTKRPPPQTSSLNAIWGTSSTNVYVVSNNQILHYDGAKAP